MVAAINTYILYSPLEMDRKLDGNVILSISTLTSRKAVLLSISSSVVNINCLWLSLSPWLTNDDIFDDLDTDIDDAELAWELAVNNELLHEDNTDNKDESNDDISDDKQCNESFKNCKKSPPWWEYDK